MIKFINNLLGKKKKITLKDLSNDISDIISSYVGVVFNNRDIDSMTAEIINYLKDKEIVENK